MCACIYRVGNSISRDFKDIDMEKILLFDMMNQSDIKQ